MGKESSDPGQPPVSLVLVDDHARFRHGIRERLTRAGANVLGEAADGEAGIALACRHRPDVVLMDLNMPGMTGIEATRQLLRNLPDARVVMLTISAEDENVSEAMLAGACGYVIKSAAVGELMHGITAARAGETFLSPPVASRLLANWRALEQAARGSADGESGLSARELEVLRHIAAGQENAEIAAKLSISTNTVKRHVAAILAKLRADNRTQAAVHAVRDGLI